MNLLCLLILFAPEAQFTKPKPDNTLSAEVAAMYREFDQLRAAHKLPRPANDERLHAQANAWAARMAAEGHMRHSSGGFGREIIASGYGDARTAFRAWMNSPGHRAALLSNSAVCGFGAAKGRSGWFWCGQFAGRPGAAVQVQAKAEPEKEPEVYQDRRGRFRWRLRAGNGRIVADSGQGYRSRQGALRGFLSARR